MSAQDDGAVEVSRDQLYTEVWADPVDVVARRYGLSGRGLGRLCERTGIPVPPRGYWAKRRAGRRVRQPPLPPSSDGGIVVLSGVRAPVPAEMPVFDPRVAALLERLARHDVAVVRSDFRGSHRVTQVVAREFAALHARRTQATRLGGDPRWAPEVSTELERRALLVFDAIARELAVHGIDLQHWSGRIGAVGVVLDKRFRFCVRERLRRKPHVPTKDDLVPRKYEYVRRGKLEIRLDDGDSWNAHAWNDGLTPLEDRVGEVLPKILRRVDARLRRDAEWAEEARREEEERRKAEAAEARRRDEAQRKMRLVREAMRWRRFRVVRAYATRVARELERHEASPGVPDHVAQWRGWTGTVLASMDPFPRRIRTELAAAASTPSAPA